MTPKIPTFTAQKRRSLKDYAIPSQLALKRVIQASLIADAPRPPHAYERASDHVEGAEMRVVILDSGLRSYGEHSFAINSALTRRLAECNIPHSLYGTKSVEPRICSEIGCIPHFSFLLYEGVSPTGFELKMRRFSALLNRKAVDYSPSEKDTAKIHNAAFEADLEALPADIWREENVILFPGLFQNQILGLARFIERHRPELRAKIVCLLMFAPNWLPWGQSKKLGPEIYRQAFSILSPEINKTVFFTTENEHVAREYAEKYGLQTSVLPVPLVGARAAQRQTDVIQIGFFGYSKTEKGYHLLPDAIEICAGKRPDLRFVIQSRHSGEEPLVVQADEKLRHIAGVRMIHGAMSPSEYVAETSQTDIALLPYDPVHFGLRGSGVFVESVSAGRPIVASKGIWAAQSIDDGKAIGAVFHPYRSDALAEAIMRVCENFPDMQKRASELASDFARTQSASAYIDRILEISKSQLSQPA